MLLISMQGTCWELGVCCQTPSMHVRRLFLLFVAPVLIGQLAGKLCVRRGGSAHAVVPHVRRKVPAAGQALSEHPSCVRIMVPQLTREWPT